MNKMCKKITSFRICSKECSPCYARGVITIEAALCIPIFLMAMLSLIYAINAYFVYERVNVAVYEEAKYASIMKYDDMSYGASAVQANIIERLGDDFFDSPIIADGKSGFDFSKTDLSDKEITVVCVNYRIKIPFFAQMIDEFEFSSKCVVHNWVGYTNGLNGYENEEEYVYMAKNGTVYHKSRDCTHIRLQIVNVKGKDIGKLRNESGGKYKQCEYCHPKKSDEKIYITKDGDRYHNTLSCAGLKRTIIRVRLSDLNGVKPCTRCGY